MSLAIDNSVYANSGSVTSHTEDIARCTLFPVVND